MHAIGGSKAAIAALRSLGNDASATGWANAAAPDSITCNMGHGRVLPRESFVKALQAALDSVAGSTTKRAKPSKKQKGRGNVQPESFSWSDDTLWSILNQLEAPQPEVSGIHGMDDVTSTSLSSTINAFSVAVAKMNLPKDGPTTLLNGLVIRVPPNELESTLGEELQREAKEVCIPQLRPACMKPI